MPHKPTTAKHVLVVEDDPDFATLLQSILAGGGYTASAAYRWEDVLRELDRKPPDLITLDVNMPAKSGVFVYRDLRADRRFDDTPIVVVTGLTRDDKDLHNTIRSLMESEELPCPVAYVEKPVEAPHFLATVQEALLCRQSRHC